MLINHINQEVFFISKLALIYGKFNILHSGHIRLFHFAKSQCDKLVVAVLQNSNTLSASKVEDRVTDLTAINLIDEILIYEDVEELLISCKPDIVVKGHEFKWKNNPERSTIDLIGAQLMFMSADEKFDVSVRKTSNFPDSENYLRSFMEKYEIEEQKIELHTLNFKNLNGLVVGDLIYDQYINCHPIGMSQEDKNIVYERGACEEYVGGAGIVAAHCNSLGSDANFVSVVGDDALGYKSAANMQMLNTKNQLWQGQGRKTILKTRYVWDDKSIFRSSILERLSLPNHLRDEFLSYLIQQIEISDYLIISDFNYGLLSSDICESILDCARRNNVMVSMDCQISSQNGDLKKYKGVELATPTEFEARSAMKDFDSGLAYLGEKLRDELEARHLILKLGSEGALIFTSIDGKDYIEKIPALNVGEVVDTSGAGDSLLATASLALSSSNDIFLSAFLGSVAASKQVTRRGNIPLNHDFWR